MLGTCKDIPLGHDTAGLRVVLHGNHMLDVHEVRFLHEPAAALIRRMQQGGDEPVALVEERLPPHKVVLIAPRHVPYSGSRKGHGRVSGVLRP